MTQPNITIPTIQFMVNATLASLTLDPKREVEDLKSEREAAAAALGELKVRDAIDAEFATRAVSAHHAAMECFRRAALPDVSQELALRMLSSAMKLARLSTQMIRALEQRKATARGARPMMAANPLQAVVAAAEAAAGSQDPMSSERQPEAPSHAAPPAASDANPGAAAKGQAGQHPMDRSAAAGSGGKDRTLKGAGAWKGRPTLTREEIAAMSGLPVSMIPAA